MNTDQNKIKDLPIFKHFNMENIEAQGKNALEKFRKGEWSIFQILKLIVIAAFCYLVWVYALPPVFQVAGQVLSTVVTGSLIVFVIILAPVIFKGLRRLTRVIHKALIKHDPFGELEEQRQKMEANKNKFIIAKGTIKNLKDSLETDASTSEKTAKDLENSIVKKRGDAQRLKSALEEMEQKEGKAVRGTDEYVQKNADLMKTMSEAQRQGQMLDQERDLVIKYGSRANVFKKLGHKLILVETAMDIKIQDFDATIKILKKDYEFASKSREATEAAKSTMLFTKGWELEYALDVVTDTIARDIAITTGNLNDINSITANFDVNSEEMFSNLDKLANDINVGASVTPDAKKYSNPEYSLNAEEKKKAGAFGDMF